MHINPIGCHILVQLDTVPTQTASGLYMGSSVQKIKQCKGTITAVGDQVTQYGPGDKVILTVEYEPDFCVTNDDKEDFVIVGDWDVCAVILDEAPVPPKNIWLTYRHR